MNLMPYKFLCDTKILCGIRNLLYMVVGSSVSRKPCDKVFLNGHIWSLDRQCHGKHVTKFSWVAIYGRWIVSVTEVMQCNFLILSMSCERDREALLRRGLVHQPRARVTIATDVMLILQFRDSNVFSYAMLKEFWKNDIAITKTKRFTWINLITLPIHFSTILLITGHRNQCPNYEPKCLESPKLIKSAIYP